MAYGNAILAGILGGLGGAAGNIGSSIALQQKEQLERERLEQERDLKQQVIDAQASQFATTQKGLSTPAETLFGYIGAPLPTGMDPKQPIPNVLGDNLIKAAQEQQKVARDQAVRGEQANVLERLGAGSPGSPGSPAIEPPDEGAMYSAGTPAIPATAAMAANPRYQAIAGLLRQGPLSEYLVKALDAENAKPIPVPETGQFWDPSTRTWLTAPGSGATATAPPDVPGMRVVASVDKNGRTTYKQEPISVGTDREGLAIDRGFPSFAQAPQPVQQEINKYLEDTSLRRSRAQGADAAGTKPLTDTDAKDINSATATLSAINQARGFSEKELTAYLGMLNRPMAEVKQVLAGMGIGDADARYNEFKAINGRLKAGMFLTAGKALTPMEEKVTSAFIVTGDERNASEYLAKMNMYDAYTRAQRETQLQMARTPRSRADLEEYDTRLAENLRRAGMNTPRATGGGGGSGGGSGWSIQRVR